jgi:hypothetical protein
MSLSRAIAIACDLNGPPGIVHPLLQENYDWVDKRLGELYHSYALSDDSSEQWSSVDSDIENQYNSLEFLPCPAPVVWVNYRSQPSQHRIESTENLEQRDREESDHIEEIYRAVSYSNINNDYYDYYVDILSPRTSDFDQIHYNSEELSDVDNDVDIDDIGYDSF